MQVETEQVQPLEMVPLDHGYMRRKRLRRGILFMAPAKEKRIVNLGIKD